MLIINWIRKIFFKLIRRQEKTLSIINYDFLKNTAKLAKKNRIVIYKGGQKALIDALYDIDNTVYILIIKKNKTKKSYNLKQWFKNFK